MALQKKAWTGKHKQKENKNKQKHQERSNLPAHFLPNFTLSCLTSNIHVDQLNHQLGDPYYRRPSQGHQVDPLLHLKGYGFCGWFGSAFSHPKPHSREDQSFKQICSPGGTESGHDHKHLSPSRWMEKTSQWPNSLNICAVSLGKMNMQM